MGTAHSKSHLVVLLRDIPSFAEAQHPELRGEHVALQQRRREVFLMRVDCLFRMLVEGSVMDADALPRVKQQVCLDRVRWIHVLVSHEPALFVVADR